MSDVGGKQDHMDGSDDDGSVNSESVGSDDGDHQRSSHQTKSVGPRRLLEVVESVYKSFNPAQVTLDTHISDSLSQLQLGHRHDGTFVRQVVYGIVRYRSFLGAIMDSFYHYNGCVC
jgi:hypothetical protein